jgi:hypothetical protein
MGIRVSITLILAALPALLNCQRAVRFTGPTYTLVSIRIICIIFSLLAGSLDLLILLSVAKLPRLPAAV